MGPRSADRGIITVLSEDTWADELQWGRDQLIAELFRGARLSAATVRFNGAAIS